MKLLSRYLSLLALPFAALSAINLIRRMGEVKLNGVFYEFIEFYQSASHAIVSFLPTIVLGLDVPDIVQDYWSISFWLVAVQIIAIDQASPDARPRLPIFEWIGRTAMILFLGYSFIGLVLGLSTIGSSLFMDKASVAKHSDDKVNLLAYMIWLRRSFIFSIVAVVMFFSLNAYSPSASQG